MPPELSLSIQYGTPAPELPRWKLRRWVRRAVDAIAIAASRDSSQAEPLSAVALTLRVVDAEEGQELNRSYRNKDYATNVLTFEYGTDPSGTWSGDIVLCLPVLYREAAEQGKAVLDHAAHLTVHGVLHALGYDHENPEEALEMEALEVHVLRTMGIADPYDD